MNFKITWLIVSAISVFNTLIAADRDSAEPSGHRDTIRVYKLGDISVTGNNSDHMLTKSNINSVSYNQIQRSDAATASEMQLYLPSARIKTNSRGEYLLFLRGAGERQLGLFFDGVPLNIAWDNRFDLSLLPMDIMGKVDVNKNASSILYGPNVLGGAVNISTYERATKGIGGKIKLHGGDGPIMQSSLTVDGKLDDFNFIGSVSYSKSDGLIIPDEHPSTLLHQDSSSSLIKNSDRRFLSVYGRAEYEFSGTDRIGLSVININGEKGVSPEMHLDDQSARFWRYPDWSRTMIASNMNFGLNSTNSIEFKGTVWADFSISK
jgi:iron complex outermembrane receptor protein